jgi:hypothetical protein
MCLKTAKERPYLLSRADLANLPWLGTAGPFGLQPAFLIVAPTTSRVAGFPLPGDVSLAEPIIYLAATQVALR